MCGTGIVCLFFILTSVYPVWSDGVLPVRLSGGSSPHQGRIEVFHDGEWGTVCDDGFKSEVCNVLCKQLGYGSEGLCINEDGQHNCRRNDGTVFREITGRIWLDELTCVGSESSIDECRKTNWGETNCGHKEDAGCLCNLSTTVVSVGGRCDKSRHRITPFDQNNPSIGRVEIQDNNKNWGLVCDDDWDDVDASVFCDCLGYKKRDSFRATLSPNRSSSLPMLYSAVRCKPQDTASTKNLWDCDVKAGNEQCDPNTEAAGVVCGPQRAWVPIVIPEVDMSCQGQWLTGCFQPESDVSADHFFLSPSCSNATISKNVDGTVCVRIDMSACEASHAKINVSTKHYCHDITFSKSGNNADHLLTESVWTRCLCCTGTKHGTAIGSFLPQMAVPSPVYKENSEANDFTMSCYRGFFNDSDALNFPATVQRGEPVSCDISIRTWDPKLYMVVSDCKFMADLNNSGPHFVFYQNKCPTTDGLDLIFYNKDHHNWGFKFSVPKFQTYDELYLFCDIYLCDMEQETKPHCDRSCSRSATPTATPTVIPSRRKRVVGRRVLYSRNSASSNPENGHIEHGPFLVKDDGFGPLINDLGQLVLVAADKSDLHQNKGSLFEMGKLGNPVPVMQTGQAMQVVASLWIIISSSLLI